MKTKALDAMTSVELVAHIIEATKYLQDFAYDEGFDKGRLYERFEQAKVIGEAIKKKRETRE